jgi:hypothetical protein
MVIKRVIIIVDQKISMNKSVKIHTTIPIAAYDINLKKPKF